MRIFFVLMLCLGSLAAENAHLRLGMNIPVFYQLHIEGDVKAEGKNPKVNFRTFSLDTNFSVILKDDNPYFPEVILTPTKLEGMVQFNHGSANFDFAKENLPFNNILVESFPLLKSFELNKSIRIPISDNTEFLGDAHQNFPILPVQNPEAYAKLARKVIDVLANGLEVKTGKAHAALPDLGLEIFSTERIIDDQFKGDYTVRFLLPMANQRSGCTDSFIGGGKFKNSSQMRNILNSQTNGIFIFIYQKTNCPDKEVEARYEWRGKLHLIPKEQTASPLT